MHREAKKLSPFLSGRRISISCIAAVILLLPFTSGCQERPPEIRLSAVAIDTAILEEREGCDIVSVRYASIANGLLVIVGYTEDALTVRDPRTGGIAFSYRIPLEVTDSIFPIDPDERVIIKDYMTLDSNPTFAALRCFEWVSLLPHVKNTMKCDSLPHVKNTMKCDSLPHVKNTMKTREQLLGVGDALCSKFDVPFFVNKSVCEIHGNEQ
jgi:hypothetical protein